MVWKAALQPVVVLIAVGVGFAVRGCPAFQRPVTLTSLSPDDALRVVLVELPTFIDRNFEIRVEEVGSRVCRKVFQSPDEGRPVGSERVVWSADGSRFLLLGRHFYVTDQGRLKTGEQAYFMMDLASGLMWCNSIQPSELPGFAIDELEAVKWLDWSPGSRLPASSLPKNSGSGSG